MADIALTQNDVARVHESQDEAFSFIAGAALNRGDIVYADSNGKLQLSNGGAAATAMALGVCVTDGQAGEPVAVVKRGKVGGFTISGLAYGAFVYISDTAGKLEDAAGTKSNVVGRVIPSSETTPQKQLYVDFDWAVVIS